MKQDITILHLSDIHFGDHTLSDASLSQEDFPKWFCCDLDNNLAKFDLSPDLTIVTGDIAAAATNNQYKQALAFFNKLASSLKLDPTRFVFVPGNHDVYWLDCKNAEEKIKEKHPPGVDYKEKIRKAIDKVKFKNFKKFEECFYGGAPSNIIQLARDSALFSFPDLNICVGVLNTCEQESHRDEDHLGKISYEQAQGLMDRLYKYPEYRNNIKILAMHHNYSLTIPAQQKAWDEYLNKFTKEEKDRFGQALQRYKSDVCGFEGNQMLSNIVEDTCPQLLLHGHQHGDQYGSINWKTSGRAHVLSAGSLWLDQNKLPWQCRNSYLIIHLSIKRRKRKIIAYAFEFDPLSRTPGRAVPGAFTPRPFYDQKLDLPPDFWSSSTKKGSPDPRSIESTDSIDLALASMGKGGKKVYKENIRINEELAIYLAIKKHFLVDLLFPILRTKEIDDRKIREGYRNACCCVIEEIENYINKRIPGKTKMSIMLFEERGNFLYFFAADTVHKKTKEYYFPLGKGLAGLAAELGEIVHTGDCSKDKRFLKLRKSMEYRSLICVPVVKSFAEGKESLTRTVGVINISHDRENAFVDEKLFSFLSEVARELAEPLEVLIDNF